MWDVGAGIPAGVRNTGAQGPRSRGEGIVILNSCLGDWAQKLPGGNFSTNCIISKILRLEFSA